MKLIARLRTLEEIDLPLRILFEFSTPALLAPKLVNLESQDELPLTPGLGRINGN